MTIAVMKTKTEQALSEAFEGVADRLPGDGAVRASRKAAIEQFATTGLPHRRIEEWKYTDLRNQLKESYPVTLADASDITVADVIVALGPLAHVDAYRVTFVDGYFRPELSSRDDMQGLNVSSLRETLAGDTALRDGGSLAAVASDQTSSVLSLNTAYMSDGAVLRIDDGAKLEKPVLIAHVSASRQPGFSAVRNVLTVGAGAEASVVEVYVTLPGAASESQSSVATETIVSDGASLTHVTCLSATDATAHLAHGLIELGSDVRYQAFHYTQDVGLMRNDLRVTFKGEGAALDLSGVFLARGKEHLDTTFVIDHAVPGCESRELFKGVLDDQARGINQGKVIVRPDAQKTDGKQMAQALMLSADAEFDSKPELEIYADDVACGHGSTCAELDPDLMFYCGSRGIPEDQARALLIQSFVGEAIDKLEHDEIGEALRAYASDWLARADA